MSNLFAGIDTNRLYLYAQMPRKDWEYGDYEAVKPGDGINVDDFSAIRQRVPGIEAMSLDGWGVPSNKISANGRTSTPAIEGTNLDGFAMQRREIIAGSAFGPSDLNDAASVCVISHSLAEDLFKPKEAVGRTLTIAKTPFLVIGVTKDDDRMRGYQSSAKDLTIILPYTSVLRRLNRQAQVSIGITAANPARLREIEQDVSDLMEERRGKRKAEFRASDVSAIIASYTSGVETMTLLLASIAGISLLVGGIGIMNIMLVSVTERTREIGIRLAIGTRERDILRQFIFEATILSLAAGLIGIGLGIGAAQVMTNVYNWKTHVTVGTIGGAFLTSAIVGIFFGWYPARKAARLDPIEALRYE